MMSHMSTRLSVCESALFRGDLHAADSGVQEILRDLVSLYADSDRKLTPPGHECVNGCVCRAGVTLLLQTSHELHRTHEDIHVEIIERYYGDTKNVPIEILLIYIDYCISTSAYEFAVRELIAYVDAHYNAPGATSLTTTNEEYTQLISVLVFDLLVPLRAYDEAIQFLKYGRNSNPKSRSVTPYQQQLHSEPDQRIPQETKDEWIAMLYRDKAAHVTQPLSAANRVKLYDEQREQHELNGGQIMPPKDAATDANDLMTNYGLTQLHNSIYANRPPHALLPIVDETALIANENLLYGSGTATSEESMENEEEDGEDNANQYDTSSSAFHSKALIPYPSLLPILPDFTSTSPPFKLSSYLASLGHRLYSFLHSRYPLLANRLRILTGMIWDRRALILAAIAAYLSYRALAFLVRFFRIDQLPGIVTIYTELRNFLRIAFITGTGRSMFG